MADRSIICGGFNDGHRSGDEVPPTIGEAPSSTTAIKRALLQLETLLSPSLVQSKSSQVAIDRFWANFAAATPSKATTVIPQMQFGGRPRRKTGLQTASTSNNTTTVSPLTAKLSYEDATATCRAKVSKIVRECCRINKKYRDPHFDLETDLKLRRRDCLQSISCSREDTKLPGSDFNPQSAKRVVDIFDKPQFFIDGPTADNVKQGRDGDCWLMSALCNLSSKKGLIESLCVAHDQDVGVYGFVFFRDGEWISEIVDDFLYLTKPDYEEGDIDRVLFDELERTEPEEAYRNIYQSNSGALYFAQCQHPQETWLPLLEKCYAKAHGDYAAIEGGFGGEGIEDLTRGVTSEIFTADILDKERFWSQELLNVNKDFLIGCSTGVWGSSRWGQRKGIIERHSYSVQKALEIDGQRLVRLRNPWGKGEWKGAWSDGSKEWTPEWLEKLGHRFGDDGDFWISYVDLLRKYQVFERTRLFDSKWHIAQQWTTLPVPWMLGYLDTYFNLKLSKPGFAVVVLSQLDDRYFRGLQGQYRFELSMRLHKTGHQDYIARSQNPYRMRRSTNVELNLEAGQYDIRVKVDAARDEDILPIHEVVQKNAKERREKLVRIGLAYDLAHEKGRVTGSIDSKMGREALGKQVRARERIEILKQRILDREVEPSLERKLLERGRKKQPTSQVNCTKMNAEQNTRFQSTIAKRSVEEAALDPDDGDNRSLTAACNRYESDSERSLESSDSISDFSDGELDMMGILLNGIRGSATKIPRACGKHDDGSPESDHDPWNAVAVVGLRVYFKSEAGNFGDMSTDEMLHLSVIRPELNIIDDIKQKTETVSGSSRRESQWESQVLDVDDSAKDATLVGGAEDRRKSIMGDGGKLS